ncbi:cytochrome P450 [Rhizorhabdus dicambivorans]|uniref:Cytochrome P450 n=1 Tax=Rhizorhabdus dicambivorans TaxID=1850238 RepID=A0A2A4FVA0_9SPHN|nr:cytochrome P450 [Rhizorhabdus dicambivorans]ATE66168.1 cytochrome P450 [Rhizorhabdus dicambivorans]PCE42094.1 cytochrome P450 [Rhizorhabdus dicambivorans]
MTSATVDIAKFNPGDPRLLRDPYSIYAEYRAADPVHWGIASMRDLEGSWYLFRFEENAEVLSDAEAYASDPASVGRQLAVPESFRPVSHIFQRWLGGMDAPDHRHLRQVLAKAFTPRRITALKPRIEAITGTLIRDAVAKDSGRFDVVRDISFPLPMAIVGDALGVGEADWHLFQNWAKDITNAVDKAGDPAAGAAGSAAIKGMVEYFGELVARRRKEPVDDLLGAMISEADDQGKPMNEFDVIAIATELGVAGHETASNAIGKGVLGMMEQRDRWAELGKLEDAALDQAIDELLRWTCPVQRQRWRWATKDNSLDGRKIERGQSVVSILGAANRDPNHFPNPDRIDFHRTTGRHMTFGLGNHFCIGSHLARLELRSVLGSLAKQFPELRLAASPEEIPWGHNSLLPGPESVPVAV